MKFKSPSPGTMSHLQNRQLAEIWQSHREDVEKLLREAFVRHAIDNRGLLTSARRADQVAQQINKLVGKFIGGEADGEEVATEAVELAEKGLALVTATEMMRTLRKVPWLEATDGQLKMVIIDRLADFQLLFLEKVAETRETLQQRAQEESQQALQRALHTQLQQQRHLNEAQKQRSDTLHQILELNTKLARITDENELLNAAVSGICQALNLADVTFYEIHFPEKHWAVRVTTAEDIKPGHVIAPAMLNRLDDILSRDTDAVEPYYTDSGQEALSVTLLLRTGKKILGAIVANSGELKSYLYGGDEFPILLRTFGQNLGILWRNLALFNETRQRAHELEILQGHYIDSLWNAQTAALQASYEDGGFQLTRNPATQYDPDQGIPLTIGNHTFGHVVLPDDIQISDEESSFIQALVREMGSALNNAHLLQTTRSYSNQLDLATEVSRAATTILDRALLIEEVVELIRARFNLYYVGLFLVDEKQEMAVLQAGTGEAGRLQLARGHKHLIGGQSMVGTTVATGQVLVEQDTTKARFFSFNPLLPETRSELALPLRSRGRVIGALTVQSVKPQAFSRETITVLQNLADQLAVAIENAGLFAQLQDTLEETSRLYEASRRISEATTQQDVYQALVDFARHSGLVDAAQVIVTDPADFNYLTSPVLWSRSELKYTPKERYPRQTFQFSEHLPQNKVIVIHDAQTDPLLDPQTRKLFQGNQVKTAAFVPIHIEGNWLGTLALHRTDSHALTDQELQPFRTLADQAAVIVANQRLFAEIQAANEQLRQLDKLKTQFLANMSHELRTPLNSIIGFSRVILKGIDGPVTADQEEDLTSIHSNGQHLLRLINEILDMAKIEAGKMMLTFEPVDLEETAQAALSMVRPMIDEKNLELRWNVAPNLPMIEADSVRLRQIFINLLSNAAKYTDEGYINLRINREGDDHVHIAVSDTGIGIAVEDFDKLFKAFEQIDSSTTRSVGGTGLGLPITKWLVTMHQGTISLESEVGKGTTFYITLPIRQDKDQAAPMTFYESLTSLPQ